MFFFWLAGKINNHCFFLKNAGELQFIALIEGKFVRLRALAAYTTYSRCATVMKKMTQINYHTCLPLNSCVRAPKKEKEHYRE
jgi:hypothetical protein